MDEEVEEQHSPRVVESVLARRRSVPVSVGEDDGMSLLNKFLLILTLVLVTGVGILCWLLAPTLGPIIRSASNTLGQYGGLWIGLLITFAIGSVIGLLRRFGLVDLLEDIVTLVLRVHQHFTTRQLHPDKLGNYPLVLDEKGHPIYVLPGNPAYPAQIAMPMTAAARKAAAKAQVDIEQSLQHGQQPLPTQVIPFGGANGTQVPLQLSAPFQQGQRPMMEDLPMKSVVSSLSSSSPIWGADATEDSRAYLKKVLPDRYDFVQELAYFRPSLTAIFMGRTINGPTFLALEHMPHLVFAGPTGVGKSKILRMVFSQLIACNVQVYMCDSHYIPYSKEEQLDWTPIEARLTHPPIRDYATSADFLEWLAREELQTRKDRAYHELPVGTPIVAGIDELAAIIDEKPEAADSLGLLLRQGRKYGICLAIAAQDLLAKSIGLDSGMIENIQTGYYGGGDLRTAKIALGLKNGEHVEEDDLGRGKVYLKTIQQRATLTRIPWPDNEAIEHVCSLSSLPVHELVREPLLETEQMQAVYQPRQQEEQGPPVANIRPMLPPARRGAQEKPIDPAHLEYVRNGGLELGNRRLAIALGTTEHQAAKMKNIVRRERGQPEEQVQEELVHE